MIRERTGPTMSHEPPRGVVNLSEIASLSREALIDRLLHFHGACPLDFSEGFLARKSTDQLRHILIAACKFAGGGS